MISEERPAKEDLYATSFYISKRILGWEDIRIKLSQIFSVSDREM